MFQYTSPTTATKYGIDGLIAPGNESARFLHGRAIGLLTNHTGLTGDGVSTLRVLRDSGARVIAIFSPEHGALGQLEGEVAGGWTADGLPIHSLYGSTRRPTAEMLRGLDVLVCDLQDVGARFYTYATTLAYALEECAAHGVAVLVADRPNPLGDTVEGPLLEAGCASFVGYLPVPVCHGMTLAELGRLHAATLAASGLAVDLRVAPVAGWQRRMRWPDTGLSWPAPSPNLPDYEAAAWYPGLCLAEFSGVAVGRGTAAPFRVVAAPWLQPRRLIDFLQKGWFGALDGIEMVPIQVVPERAIHAGILCPGVRFTHRDGVPPHPVALGLTLLAALHRAHPVEFDAAALRAALPLLGSSEALGLLLGGDAAAAWRISCGQAALFRDRRAACLIYDA